MAKIKKSFGQQTIGGGGSGGGEVTPDSNLYYLVGGNDLPYVSVSGCIHTTSTITGATSGWSNGVPATLPDGLCWLKSLDNASIFYIGCNDANSLINYDISSQVVWAVRDGSLSYDIVVGEEVVQQTYPKYRICGAF